MSCDHTSAEARSTLAPPGSVDNKMSLLNTPRVLHGQRLGNESTHRPSEHIYAARCLSTSITCAASSASWRYQMAVRCRGATILRLSRRMSSLEEASPSINGRIPVRTCRGETVQDDKRSAVANSTISNLGPIDLEFLERLIGASATLGSRTTTVKCGRCKCEVKKFRQDSEERSRVEARRSPRGRCRSSHGNLEFIRADPLGSAIRLRIFRIA